MTLKTVLNKVIVEPVEAETVTKGGIIIPDTAQEKPQKGTVIATGKDGSKSRRYCFIRKIFRYRSSYRRQEVSGHEPK